LNNLGVIPGKLAIASATRNPGGDEELDTRFRGYECAREGATSAR